jgi:hypothetical protein
MCAGFEWSLLLCPGGSRSVTAKDGMISMLLQAQLLYEMAMNWEASIMSKHGVYTKRAFCDSTFFYINEAHGEENFALCSVIVDPSNNILNDGTLTITICMWPGDEYNLLRNYAPGHTWGEYDQAIS